MKENTPKLVDVVLAKAHTHAGVSHQAGAKIQVTEPERDWLQANQVIAPSKETGK